MVKNRKLFRDNPHDYRLYKFETMVEMIKTKEDFEKNYKRSVIVIDENSGVVDDVKLRNFSKMADDNAYLQLELKETDIVLLTKELTPRKMEDERRLQKMVKHYKKPVEKSTIKPSKNWSEEELEHLWKGTAEEVSKILNKDISIVKKRRNKYVIENPAFEIPKECQTPRSNAKVILPEREWTKEEDDVLWSSTGAELCNLLKRNKFEIAERRRDYCRINPEFVIPHEADFRKGSLQNKVSSKKQQKVKIQNVDFLGLPVEEPIVEQPVIKQAAPSVSPALVHQQQHKTNKPKETDISMLASLLNKLDNKPKKVQIGNITLEF